LRELVEQITYDTVKNKINGIKRVLRAAKTELYYFAVANAASFVLVGGTY